MSAILRTRPEHPIAATLMAFVVSCSDENTSKPKAQELPPNTGNFAHDTLMKLTEAEQATHLGRVIEEGCTGVRAFFMGMEPRLAAAWSVGCTNGLSYSVSVFNDGKGTTNYIDCRVMKTMINIDCFVSYDAQKGQLQKSDFMCGLAQLPHDLRAATMSNIIDRLREFIVDAGERPPSTREATLKMATRLLDDLAGDCGKPVGNAKPVQPQTNDSKKKICQSPSQYNPYDPRPVCK